MKQHAVNCLSCIIDKLSGRNTEKAQEQKGKGGGYTNFSQIPDSGQDSASDEEDNEDGPKRRGHQQVQSDSDGDDVEEMEKN